MATAVLVWAFLTAFWVENYLPVGKSSIEGATLANLALYALLLRWVFAAVERRRLLRASNLNLPLLLYLSIAALGIPLKSCLERSVCGCLERDHIF